MPEPSTAARPAGRRSSAVAARTRATIVTAATQLFAERGVDGVSTREIAQAAGVAHGLVRHHFGSKEGLWTAVLDAADAQFASTLTPLAHLAASAAGQNTAAVRAALAAFITGFIEACSRQPAIARLLVHESTAPGDRLDDVLSKLDNARAALAPVAAQLRALNQLPSLADEELLLVLLLVGLVPFGTPALTERVLGQPLSPERHAQVVIASLLGGH